MKQQLLNVWIIVGITAFLLISCTTTGKLERMQDGFISPEQYYEQQNIPKFLSTLPELYFTGIEWNERSMELIREAQDYILITIFLGNYHETTHEVWELLRQRMDEGIRVYLIIDSSSYFQLDPMTEEVVPAVFSHLDEIGIPYTEYNPMSLSSIFFPFGLLDRDHRKYWIIDGEIIVAGGININYTSLGLPPETGNIDTMAEIVSPEAAGVLVRSFVDTWNAYSPRRIKAEDFSIGKGISSRTEQIPFWLIDHDFKSSVQVTDMFNSFFLSVEKELWLIQGYAFLTPALIRRISYAVSRGVEVHIVLSEYSRKPNYEQASWYGMLDLIDAGATVYMYTSPTGAFLHYKLMMADRRLTALGSVNYNLRSQTASREISFIFDDSRVGARVMDNIEELMKHTRVVTREEALEHRTFQGFLYLLLMQFWG